MAAIGWFLLCATVAPGVSWWRAGRRDLAVIVASLSVLLPLFMLIVLPRVPQSASVLFALGWFLVICTVIQSAWAAVVLRRDATRTTWATTISFGVAVVAAGIPARVLVPTQFESFAVPSEGMEPSLQRGDQFFVLKNRTQHPIERGSVVVLWQEDTRAHFVKRVVGLPGDTIAMEGASLWINGELVKSAPCTDTPGPCALESFGDRTWRTRPGSRLRGTWSVSEGEYFVIGDNRDNSDDSRHFGPVLESNVLGVAKYVHFSWPSVSRTGGAIDPE